MDTNLQLSFGPRRVKHWELTFQAFLETRRDMPFQWGVNDCCLFTCDGIQAITGADLAFGIRGEYDSALSAGRKLEDLGGVEAIAAQRCGALLWPEVTPTKARRGDPVSMDMDGLITLGLCNGLHSAFIGPNGILWHPTLNARRAWRVA